MPSTTSPLVCRPLTLADVAACVDIEREAFPPCEQCSYEKSVYRLRVAPELCLGVVDITNGEEKLVAHAVGCRTSAPLVTEQSMKVPRKGERDAGHVETGRTLALHSLAVRPSYHGRGVGSMLLKEYLMRIEQVEGVDRIAIIAHEHLVPFYTRNGFGLLGKSANQFGVGGWLDLVKEISHHESHALATK